jgi:hypothetical protein
MAAGNLSEPIQQVPLHRHRPRSVCRPVKGRLQEVSQKCHHPHEHRGIGHRRVAHVDATGPWRLPGGRWDQRQRRDRRGDRGGREESLGLKPRQITAHRLHLAVTGPMKPAQQPASPLRQITAGQG